MPRQARLEEMTELDAWDKSFAFTPTSPLTNCASILCYLPMVSGGEVILLGDKHKKAGIVCEECHEGGTSKGDVTNAICFKCHIGYSKLAERTSKITPNPHESHIGYLECVACHHIHKLSEDYCGECHKFSFKVP